MKFDIARQPLVPAFLTLAALAVVAMWNAGGPAVSMAVQAGHAAGTVDIGRNAAGALAVSSPGELLAQFQAAHPVWARWIAGLLMLFTGMSVGRLTVRYNLYSVGTCLAIPLYGAIACGLAVGGDCLTTFAASALLALATKNFCRSYCNGFGFDAIFRASLYIGLLPLVATAAAPLLILLPLALIFSENSMSNLQTVSIIASWLIDTKSGKTCSNTHRKTGRISDVYTVLTPNSRPIKRKPTTRSAAFKIKVSTEIGSGITFPKSIARPEILPTDTPLGIRKK